MSVFLKDLTANRKDLNSIEYKLGKELNDVCSVIN